MMSARRRLTPDQEDRNDAQEQRRYDDLHAEIEAADRDEHDREFGPGSPFQAHSASIHRRVTARMQADHEAQTQG